MASTKAPLFGLDASGSLGGAIVFAKWKGRSYVRMHSVPSNPNTLAQIGVRALMKFITQDFTNLTAPEVQEWDDLAASDQITALNAQVRDGMNRAKIGQGWREFPTATALTTIDPPTGLTLTALPKGVRIAWTRPAAHQGNYSVAVYLSETTGFTPSRNNLRVVLPVASVTVDVLDLATGIPVYARVRETSQAGELGTLVAQGTATPT